MLPQTLLLFGLLDVFDQPVNLNQLRTRVTSHDSVDRVLAGIAASIKDKSNGVDILQEYLNHINHFMPERFHDKRTIAKSQPYSDFEIESTQSITNDKRTFTSSENYGSTRGFPRDKKRRVLPTGSRRFVQVEDFATGGRLPWECPSESFWRDLGSQFSPRFIHDKRCSTQSCWFGHRLCVPNKYSFNVFRAPDADESAYGRSDFMANNMVLDVVNVTISCSCI